MLTLTNDKIALTCAESGRGLTMADRATGQVWTQDEMTLVYATSDATGHASPLMPLAPDSAEVVDGALVVHMLAGETPVTMRFSLLPDGVEVHLPPVAGGITALSLPGSFVPTQGKRKYLLPIMQGMLWDGRGEPHEKQYAEAAHGGFTMAMFGVLGETGGLLTAAETADDCLWWVGKAQDGRTWATNLQVQSLGSMRYERVMRLYPVASNMVPLIKRYRARVIERGRFITWQQKMVERPGLERLFGAVMCFIGYCQDDLDYVAEARKLKAYGFDKALIYPVRFNTYREDFLMGGFPPIDLSREAVAGIKELGFDVAPWTWINEALDDGSEKLRGQFRIGKDGKAANTWQIDEQKWYAMCTTEMEAFLRKQNAGPFNDMTWDHFDVITCATNKECHATNHPKHMGYALSRTEDRGYLRNLLLAGRDGHKAVSSENFNDAYSLEADLGSVKAWPQYGPWPYWPIPMTMLAYHDSMMHTWWEPHNYNMRYFDRQTDRYQYGGGRARLMASMDALYGCPPDVFPFGAMYGWQGDGHSTFLYKSRFEDPETQFALAQALPVAKLHGRIGMQEMVDYQMLTDDGALQMSTFADGTRVYANLGLDGARYVDGVGGIQSESWVEVPPDR